MFGFGIGLWAFGFGLTHDSKSDPVTQADPPQVAVTQDVEPVEVVSTDKLEQRPDESLPNDHPVPQTISAMQDGIFVLPAMSLATAPTTELTAGGVACSSDRTLGTAITWAESPRAAFVEARRSNKLVYLIHVSGNFEQPGFT